MPFVLLVNVGTIPIRRIRGRGVDLVVDVVRIGQGAGEPHIDALHSKPLARLRGTVLGGVHPPRICLVLLIHLILQSTATSP